MPEKTSGSGTGGGTQTSEGLQYVNSIKNETEFLNFLRQVVWHGRQINISQQKMLDACATGYERDPSNV